MPALNLNSNLNEQQRTSITNLLGSGRTMNQTDAQNLAYATGQSANWQQFFNQSASNYSIGNLAQFAAPAQANTNPANGTGFTIPGMGPSNMEQAGFTTVGLGMTQNDQAIINLMQQREAVRAASEKATQTQYDNAYAGLGTAYNQEVSRADIDKQFKIDEQIQQLTNINNQLATLTGAYQAANNAIGNQPINTAIIRGQQFLKTQEYNNKATVLAAQADIIQGNLTLANSRAKDYYDAATANRTDAINKYTTLLGLASNKLIKLDEEETSNINTMIDTLKAAETRQTENKDKISALLLDPVAAAAWTKTPGLSLDMDYNTLVQTLLPQIVAENTRIETMKNVRTGSGGSGGGSGTAPQSELDKTVQEYAYQAISLEKYGTKAEKDAAFANVVNSLVADSGGAMSYSTASIALIQMMQQLKGEIVNYGGTNTMTPEQQMNTNQDSIGSDFVTTNPAQEIGEFIWKVPTWIGKQILTAPGKIGSFLTSPKKKKK